jgi:hypothetical protein
MNTADVARTLGTLHNELVRGTPPTGGYMLNRHDDGLLGSLGRLSAAGASEIIDGGSSIAAHVDHVLYYTSLMNRWAAGEKNPWKDADWKESWTRPAVTQESWAALRIRLEDALRQWSDAISQPREVTESEFAGMVASPAHLAYHLGAIRQMDRKIGGPSANNEVDAFAPSGGLGAAG